MYYSNIPSGRDCSGRAAKGKSRFRPPHHSRGPNMSAPFTPEERWQVNQFIELVELMMASRFIRDARAMDHTVRCETLPDDTTRFTSPEYDEEYFMAFLTRFRQVAI